MCYIRSQVAVHQDLPLVQLRLQHFADHPGWGVSVVLSDLTEATVFHKGDDSKDIVHIPFQNLKDVGDDHATVVIASWQDLLTIFTIHYQSSVLTNCFLTGVFA